MTDRDPVRVINLWPIESDCGACGTRLVNARHGIPVYEDLVLPNDWQGELGGRDACLPCYTAQQALAEPVTCRQLVEMRGAS